MQASLEGQQEAEAGQVGRYGALQLVKVLCRQGAAHPLTTQLKQEAHNLGQPSACRLRAISETEILKLGHKFF